MNPGYDVVEEQFMSEKGATMTIKDQLAQSKQTFLLLKEKIVDSGQVLIQNKLQDLECEKMKKKMEDMVSICETKKLEVTFVKNALSLKTEHLLNAEKERNATVYNLQSRIYDLENQISSMNSMKIQYEAKIDELKEQLDKDEEKTSKLSNHNRNLRRQITKLRKNLPEKVKIEKEENLLKKMDDISEETSAEQKFMNMIATQTDHACFQNESKMDYFKVQIDVSVVDITPGDSSFLQSEESLKAIPPLTDSACSRVLESRKSYFKSEHNVSVVDIAPFSAVLDLDDVESVVREMKELRKQPLSPLKEDHVFLKPLPPGPLKKTSEKSEAELTISDSPSTRTTQQAGKYKSTLSPTFKKYSSSKSKQLFLTKVPFLYREVKWKKRYVFKRLGTLTDLLRTDLSKPKLNIIHTGEITRDIDKIITENAAFEEEVWISDSESSRLAGDKEEQLNQAEPTLVHSIQDEKAKGIVVMGSKRAFILEGKPGKDIETIEHPNTIKSINHAPALVSSCGQFETAGTVQKSAAFEKQSATITRDVDEVHRRPDASEQGVFVTQCNGESEAMPLNEALVAFDLLDASSSLEVQLFNKTSSGSVVLGGEETTVVENSCKPSPMMPIFNMEKLCADESVPRILKKASDHTPVDEYPNDIVEAGFEASPSQSIWASGNQFCQETSSKPCKQTFHENSLPGESNKSEDNLASSVPDFVNLDLLLSESEDDLTIDLSMTEVSLKPEGTVLSYKDNCLPTLSLTETQVECRPDPKLVIAANDFNSADPSLEVIEGKLTPLKSQNLVIDERSNTPGSGSICGSKTEKGSELFEVERAKRKQLFVDDGVYIPTKKKRRSDFSEELEAYVKAKSLPKSESHLHVNKYFSKYCSGDLGKEINSSSCTEESRLVVGVSDDVQHDLTEVNEGILKEKELKPAIHLFIPPRQTTQLYGPRIASLLDFDFSKGVSDGRLELTGKENLIAKLKGVKQPVEMTGQRLQRSRLGAVRILQALNTPGWNARTGIDSICLKFSSFQRPRAIPLAFVSILRLDKNCPILKKKSPAEPSLTQLQQRCISCILALEQRVDTCKNIFFSICSTIRAFIFESPLEDLHGEYKHLLRFYCALAKCRKRLDMVRCLIIDVVYHFRSIAADFVLIICSQWPEALRKGADFPKPSVVDQMIAYLFTCNTQVSHIGCHRDMVNLLETYYKLTCKKKPIFTTAYAFCDHLIYILKTSPDTQELFLLSLCIAVLCRWEGITFVCNDLLERRLLPLFEEWKEGKVHNKAGAFAVIAIGQVARLMYSSYPEKINQVCDMLSQVLTDDLSEIVRDSIVEALLLIDVTHGQCNLYGVLQGWKKWSIDMRLVPALSKYVLKRDATFE